MLKKKENNNYFEIKSLEFFAILLEYVESRIDMLKNSGCYASLNLPWTYNGKIEKMAFIKPLQIF